MLLLSHRVVDQINELKAEISGNDGISKYKEFLRRTQSECKELESNLKMVEEKHKKEVDNLIADKMLAEEKYLV